MAASAIHVHVHAKQCCTMLRKRTLGPDELELANLTLERPVGTSFSRGTHLYLQAWMRNTTRWCDSIARGSFRTRWPEQPRAAPYAMQWTGMTEPQLALLGYRDTGDWRGWVLCRRACPTHVRRRFSIIESSICNTYEIRETTDVNRTALDPA